MSRAERENTPRASAFIFRLKIHHLGRAPFAAGDIPRTLSRSHSLYRVKRQMLTHASFASTRTHARTHTRAQ